MVSTEPSAQSCPDTTNGTAIYMPISWGGGSRGVNVGVFFLNRNGVDRNPLGPPGAALCSFSDMFEKVKQALSTRLGVAPVRSSALVATRDPIATATGNGMDLLSFWCRRCIDVLVSFLFFPMILLPLLPPGGFG